MLFLAFALLFLPFEPFLADIRDGMEKLIDDCGDEVILILEMFLVHKFRYVVIGAI